MYIKTSLTDKTLFLLFLSQLSKVPQWQFSNSLSAFPGFSFIHILYWWKSYLWEIAQHCSRGASQGKKNFSTHAHRHRKCRNAKCPKVNDQLGREDGKSSGLWDKPQVELHFRPHRKLFEFPLLDYFRQTNKSLGNFLLHTSLRAQVEAEAAAAAKGSCKCHRN